MPQWERLGLKRNCERNINVELNAQNQRSPQRKYQTKWQLDISTKWLPLEFVKGECTSFPLSQTVASSEPRTKLIDLNYDCLEPIFLGISLANLVSIGDTCTDLKSAACRYFQTKYRKHTVFIDCAKYPNYSLSSAAMHQKIENGNDIDAFMFAFGEVLSKLTIISMCAIAAKDPERLKSDAKIQYLIEKYCRKNLRELSFLNCGKLTMSHSQPFENVTKVSFDHCALGENFANFGYFFPKMRRLDLIDCDVCDVCSSIERELSQLEYLNLNVPFSENSLTDSFTLDNAKAVINRNPNIKHLNLRYWNASAYDAKLLKYAIDNLQLKSLQLWHTRYTDFWSDGNILCSSVQKLVLVNYVQPLGYLDRNLASLHFEKLRKFSILNQFDTECTTFVARHKTITELCIVPSGKHDWYPSDDDIIRFFNVLPKLERLLVNGRHMTSKGLIHLISKRSNLSAIKVHQYSFSAAIRKLFRCKCTQLGWSVVYDTESESDMTIKRPFN